MGALNPDQALIQQDTGIQDPQQATQNTQQAVDLMNEHVNSNPQGIQSLFNNSMGRAGGQNQDDNILGKVL